MQIQTQAKTLLPFFTCWQLVINRSTHELSESFKIKYFKWYWDLFKIFLQIRTFICVFSCVFRDTEYKGLQLSLDQATSRAYFSYSSRLPDSCKTFKSRVARPKTKARHSPYTQVRVKSNHVTQSTVVFNPVQLYTRKLNLSVNVNRVPAVFPRSTLTSLNVSAHIKLMKFVTSALRCFYFYFLINLVLHNLL